MQPLYKLIFIFLSPLVIYPTYADSASDMTDLQKKLNQETLNKPFSVEESTKIDNYINDAMKKNIQPKKNPPADWHSGSTCDSYYGNRYDFYGYRDCLYYHRYYGRYW